MCEYKSIHYRKMSAFCVVKRKNRKEDTLLLKFHLIFFFPRKKSLGEEEGCAENSNFCQKNKKKFMRTGTSHSDIIFFFENKIKSQRATWLCFSTCFSYKNSSLWLVILIQVSRTIQKSMWVVVGVVGSQSVIIGIKVISSPLAWSPFAYATQI